jgi:hypothetical protein
MTADSKTNMAAENHYSLLGIQTSDFKVKNISIFVSLNLMNVVDYEVILKRV